MDYNLDKLPYIKKRNLEKYKEIFNRYKQGLTFDNFLLLIRNAGANPSEKKAEEIYKKFCSDDDLCYLNFENFLKIINELLNVNHSGDLREAFSKLDRDGNGFISFADLKKVLSNHGDKFSEFEIEEFYRNADVDKNGFLNYDDFITAVCESELP